MKLFAAILISLCILSTMNPAQAATPSADEKVESLDLSVGTMGRHYLLFTPAGLMPQAPLLIAFHPSGSSAAKMRLMSSAILERLARERGFAIAYPDGFEGHFNDCRRMASFSARKQNIDDVGFTRAMIADAAKRIGSDANRVYALGYSNGGHMAMRLSLETPELIGGAIVIAANFPTDDNIDCPAADAERSHKPSMVFINGTADPINPYEGGDVTLYGTTDRGNVRPAVDGAQWYAKRYGLAEQASLPDLDVKGLTAHWRDWGQGQPSVRLITIEEGGHTIPQAKFDFPASLMLGKTFRSDAPLESAFDTLGMAR
jgi:polyhydroxybutyrate depolymerase